MPKLNQYLIVKAQVESFRELGCATRLQVQGFYDHFAPKIQIITGRRQYRFSDANWDIVSSQLAKLYGVVRNEKRIHV